MILFVIFGFLAGIYLLQNRIDNPKPKAKPKYKSLNEILIDAERECKIAIYL